MARSSDTRDSNNKSTREEPASGVLPEDEIKSTPHVNDQPLPHEWTHPDEHLGTGDEAGGGDDLHGFEP